MTDKILNSDIDRIGRIGIIPTVLKVVSELTGMRVSLVARVTSEAWMACSVNDQMRFGLAQGDSIAIGSTICRDVQRRRSPVVVEDIDANATYCEHRAREKNIRSYISVPIFDTDGTVFGTLCAFDSASVRLPPRVVSSMALFAELIGIQLQQDTQHELTKANLVDERALSQLREEFIAVLGHDLRSPLSAILTASSILKVSELGKEECELVDVIRGSGEHIGKLVDDVLDLARGRLGGGIEVDRRRDCSVLEILRQVVESMKREYPERICGPDLGGEALVLGDSVRLRQVFTNLLANGLENSPEDSTVRISVSAVEGDWRIDFENCGPGISEEVRAQLFNPFKRKRKNKRSGLGLGLYICHQIVKAHHGRIEVESTEGRTVFSVFLSRCPEAIS